jgi:hypothetical protein
VVGVAVDDQLAVEEDLPGDDVLRRNFPREGGGAEDGEVGALADADAADGLEAECPGAVDGEAVERGEDGARLGGAVVAEDLAEEVGGGETAVAESAVAEQEREPGGVAAEGVYTGGELVGLDEELGGEVAQAGDGKVAMGGVVVERGQVEMEVRGEGGWRRPRSKGPRR